MSVMTASSVSPSIDSLLKQAKTAVQQGQRQQARRLLQQAVRQDPQDFRGWLWLATVAQSPQASLEYINRAEMLAPNNDTVSKARRWAEKRLAQVNLAAAESTPISPAESHNWPKIIRWAVLTLFVLLAGVGTVYAWQYFRPDEAVVETAVLNSSLTPAKQTDSLAEVALVPDKPTATQTPQPHSPAKAIASTGADQPRPTWTVTPTPSPTPTPTPTTVPTFISPNNQNAGRPFGVAANERWVNVNLTSQTLTAYEGDTAVFSTLISSGTWDHPTVTGQFRIWLEFESQTMDGSLLGYDYYLENVPYVMYFFEDYALHGTFWHNNFGSPMSHGCVNMQTDDAGWLYNFVTVGTMVNVHY
ncbi:MAG: L,D-transpeptidase [Chloroflexi bacterium]|nr:L,D-transpeptidase [Chloroflexota bacterium]